MKDVLSIEIVDAENSKFWLSVLSSLKARGVKDILILCSDRLTGIDDAITAVYPQTDWQGFIIQKSFLVIIGKIFHLCFHTQKN